jgi:hypothetical protein
LFAAKDGVEGKKAFRTKIGAAWQHKIGKGFPNDLISVHPEAPDGTLAVSNPESRDFSFWPGNRGLARKRTWVRCTRKPKD